jgi:hypothetical protein
MMSYQKGIGNRLLFVDESDSAFIYSPVLDTAFTIPWQPEYLGALWETEGSHGTNVFVAWKENQLDVFYYNPFTVKGQECNQLQLSTRLPLGFQPIMFRNNQIVCQVFND